MMKSLKFSLIISLFMLLAVGEVWGCVVTIYTPAGYHMYRIFDLKASRSTESQRVANCKAWRQIIPVNVSLEEIEEVVYSLSLDEYKQIYIDKEYYGYNNFAGWLKSHQSDIGDFLLLAKQNEELRDRYSSPWYYPSMKVRGEVTLEDIVIRSLSNTNPQLRDRYLLQAVRALFTLRRYQECIALWDEQISQLSKDNVMRSHIVPYIAGARARLGDYKAAFETFAEVGDIASMRACAKAMGQEMYEAEAIEAIYNNCDDSYKLLDFLQSYVRRAENWHFETNWGAGRGENMTEGHRKLRDVALRIASRRGEKQPALWYYTAAVLYDIEERVDDAHQALSKAERYASGGILGESIEIMRVYLDAKRLPCDSHYDRHLLSLLKPIISNVESSDSWTYGDSSLLYNLWKNKSMHYQYDMLRRIVLDVMIPRMIRCDMSVRALQYANLVDNMLTKMYNPKCGVSTKMLDYTYNYSYYADEEYLNRMRSDSEVFNEWDYSNVFFALCNVLDIEDVEKYVRVALEPRNATDVYFNSRSYIERNYLCDLMGTLNLRHMRYIEAESWLSKVEGKYSELLNVRLDVDPFTLEERTPSVKDFRYQFAREMASLKCGIDASDDANRKALLMERYATGMVNSFIECWPLTHYQNGYVYSAYNWIEQIVDLPFKVEPDEPRDRAIERYNEMMNEALNMATDDEVLASLHYRMHNYRIVGTRFAHTQVGRYVNHSCDRLVDYHSEKIDVWWRL